MVKIENRDLQQQLQAINVDAEQQQQYINQGSQIVRLEVAHAIQAVQQMINLVKLTYQNRRLRI